MYANGRAPQGALVSVTGVLVTPDIAPRLTAFFAFAASQGHTLRVFDGRTIGRVYAEGGYCDYPAQAERQRYGTSGGSKVAVADPGESTHGVYAPGRVDIVGRNGHSYTDAELAFMVRYAGQFGLVREFGSADPNHFIASGGFAGGSTTPIEEDDMTPDQAQKLDAIYDALFKKDPVQGSTTGGVGMPGGLLRMAQIQYDANFQEKGVKGATRDGVFAFMDKVRQKLGIS